MSNLQKLDLQSLPRFVVAKDGIFTEVTWNYFNPEWDQTNPNTPEHMPLVLSDEEVINAEFVLDLDGQEGSVPVTWDNILKAVEGINTRIDNNLPFDHFTNYTNPTFFYRIAMGIATWGDDYLNELKSNVESFVLVSMAHVLVKAKEQEHIAKIGFSVKGVFPTKEGGINFAYTIGLDRGLVIAGVFSLETMNQIINVIGRSADDDRWVIGKPLEMEEFVIGDKPLRVQLNIVEHNSLLEWAKASSNILIQVVVGDENNILPSEEGYNDELKQDLSLID